MQSLGIGGVEGIHLGADRVVLRCVGVLSRASDRKMHSSVECCAGSYAVLVRGWETLQRRSVFGASCAEPKSSNIADLPVLSSKRL